jgi:hypothetical protein
MKSRSNSKVSTPTSPEICLGDSSRKLHFGLKKSNQQKMIVEDLDGYGMLLPITKKED